MKILVIGSGGREHALAWKLAQSPRAAEIYCAPGNPGVAKIVKCVPAPADDLEGLLRFATDHRVDLTVVGPEIPLAMGIVDSFEKRGLRIFGPRRDAARIESSKAFSKHFMASYGIPTARSRTFNDPVLATAYVRKHPLPLVIKASGLAAGKGVVVAQTLQEAEGAIDQIMRQKVFGAAGEETIVEEFLAGEEATVLAFTDGREACLMPPSQDHKRVYDKDQGANTGGMGAYAPAPVVTAKVRETVLREIIQPTLQGLSKEGCPYRGVLYIGLMICRDGPKVLEYNCRFGDPEAQVVLPLLESDLVDVLEAVIDERLNAEDVRWRSGSALCVVLASEGYPGAFRKGFPIQGLEGFDRMPDVLLFHAGTASEGREVVTAGGRVLGLTALGADLRQSRDRAYDAVRRISFEGMHYRKDIGIKALGKSD